MRIYIAPYMGHTVEEIRGILKINGFPEEKIRTAQKSLSLKVEAGSQNALWRISSRLSELLKGKAFYDEYKAEAAVT